MDTIRLEGGCALLRNTFKKGDLKMQNSKYNLPSDLYTVGIEIGKFCYLYFRFSQNHQEAIEEALACHAESVGPVPSGTRLLVYGQCRDTNCDCGGKNHGIIRFTGSADVRASC